MICFQDTHVNFKCCDANAIEDANANFKCYDANANFKCYDANALKDANLKYCDANDLKDANENLNVMMQTLLKIHMQI